MNKISLVIVAVFASISLAACGNSSSHKAANRASSSSKVVHHHKHHKRKAKKETSSSSSSSSSVSSANNTQQQQGQQTQQATNNQTQQSNVPMSEDQARAQLGGANGDLQATRTGNGWTFSGDGYTATVGDDGTVTHN